MSDKVWVMVETIGMFRQRYMVETDQAHPEYALDDVTLERPKEFSQKYLGETITSHRVVSEAEALDICDVDNDYCHGWTDQQKINAFFTKDGETRDF